MQWKFLPGQSKSLGQGLVVSVSSGCGSGLAASPLVGSLPSQSNEGIELSQCFSRHVSTNHSVKQSTPQDINICYAGKKMFLKGDMVD